MLRRSLSQHLERMMKRRRRSGRRHAVRQSIEIMEPRQLLTTLFWDGGGDGTSWGDAANWRDDAGVNPQQAPGSTDHAVIDMTGTTYTVRLSSATTVEQVTINSPSADFEVKGFDLNVLQSIHVQTVNAFRLENARLSAQELVNDAVITARRTARIDAAEFTNNDQLNVFASSGTGHGDLTLTSGLVNHGLVNLIIGGGRNATLSLDSGVLLNQPTGEIRVSSGSGAGFLQGDVDNFGTINLIDDSSNFNRPGAILNNHGEVNVASTGRLFGSNAVINQIAGTLTNDRDVRLEANGTLNFSGGVIQNNSSGSEIFHVQHLVMTGGEHNGSQIVVTNGTLDLGVVGANDAAFQLRKTNTVSGVVAEGMTVRMLKQPNLASTTTFASGFTNHGLLLFNRSSTTDNSASVATGEITNGATGVIRLDNKVDFNNAELVSSGLLEVNADSRHRLSGTFTNSGDIVVDAAAQWNEGVGSNLIHNGGLITNHGDFRVFGQMTVNADIINNGLFDVTVGGSNPPGELTFQSGTITGNSLIVDGGQLDIQGTTPNTFVVQGSLSTNEITGTVAAGQNVIAKAKGSNPPIVSIADGTVINGTLIVDTTGASTLGRLQSTSASPIVIGPTGRLVIDGTVRDLAILSDIVNLGTIDINGRPSLQAGRTLQNFGTLNINGGGSFISSNSASLELLAGTLNIDPAANPRINAPVRYLGGQINGEARIRTRLELGENAGNSGTFVMEPTSSLQGDILSGQTIVIESGIVNVEGDLNNAGTLILANPTGSTNVTELDFNGSRFQNSVNGVVRIQTGGNTLGLLDQTDLFNDGQILVESGRFGYGGALTNRGRFEVHTGARFQSPGPGTALFLDRGVVDIKGAFSYSGPQFEYNGGAIEGVVELGSSTIAFGDNVEDTSAFRAVGPSITLLTDIPAGVSLQLSNPTAGFLTQLTTDVPRDIQINGTVQLGADGDLGNAQILVNASRRLMIGDTGSLLITGAEGTRTVQAEVINRGTLTADREWTLGRTNGSENHRNRGLWTTNGDLNLRGNSFINESGGEIRGTGTWDLHQSVVTNNGIIAPGNSPGVLTFDGDVELTSLSLVDIQIGGTTPGSQFDRLTITGNAVLGGLLKVGVIDNHVPQSGEVYRVLNFGSASGEFGLINGLDSGITSVFTASYAADGLDLNSIASGLDLATSIDSIPVTATAGQPIEIEYRVTNLGEPITNVTRKDIVFLSQSSTFDPRLAFRVIEVEHTCSLATGESCEHQVTAAVPGLTPGAYFVHVVADTQQIIADSNRANNLATSTEAVAVSADPLELGQTNAGTITAGQNFYWQLQLTEAQATRLEVTTDQPDSVRVFLSPDVMPSNWNFDFEAQQLNATTLQHDFNDDQPRTWFVHLRALPAASNVNYSLTWDAVPLSVRELSTTRVSNLGSATVSITGTAFASDAVVELRSPVDGSVVAAANVHVENTTELHATFDFAGVAKGFYDLVVVSGGETAFCGASACFEVASLAEGKATVFVSLPDTARAGREIQGSITVTNTGFTDIAPPLYLVTFNNAVGSLDETIFGSDALSESVLLLSINNDSGSPGTLSPSSSHTYDFRMIPRSGSYEVTVDEIDDAQTIDWLSLKDSLRPLDIPADAWEIVFGNFMAKAGATVGDYREMLTRISSDLEEFGNEGSPDAGLLTRLAIHQANDAGNVQTAFVDGTFGRGIADPFAFHLEFSPDGQQVAVTVGGSQQTLRSITSQGPSSAVDATSPDGRGIFVGAFGGLSMLVPNTSGGFSFVNEQQMAHFNANNQIDRIEDLLTGEITSVERDSNGRIAALIDESNQRLLEIDRDPAGRATQLRSLDGSVTNLAVDSTGVVSNVSSPDFQFNLASFESLSSVVADPGVLLTEFTQNNQTVTNQFETGTGLLEVSTEAILGSSSNTIQATPTGGLSGFLDAVGNRIIDAGESVINSIVDGVAGVRTIVENALSGSEDFDGQTVEAVKDVLKAFGGKKLSTIINTIDTADRVANGRTREERTPLRDLGNAVKNLPRTLRETPDRLRRNAEKIYGIDLPPGLFVFGALSRVGGATGDSVLAIDPNDILGPAGVGEGRHLTKNQRLDYTIRFENQVEATAPAQEVFITQTLDPDLDFSTYELEEFGFGDLRFRVPEGRNSFQALVDLQEQAGLLVRVSADINELTGEIRWMFQSVDPETGTLPADPLAGFLPPNLVPGEGEGFVRYSIRPKQTLVSGDRLDAEARIVFDVNEAIATPPIFNTIDAGTPMAVVAPLPGSTPTDTFTVSWTGSDDAGGSGIAFYDIFVSEDDGPFEVLLEQTAATSFEFSGQSGSTYRFIAVATDLVGHRQEFPPQAQAETTIEPAEGVVVLVNGDLVVIGTSRNDRIQIQSDRRQPERVAVKLNGRNLGRFSPTGIIRVEALAGNDRVIIDHRVQIDAVIDGGDGNDRLEAGGGNDILLGGRGNDRLAARSGNNRLHGGDGDDELHSGPGHDELFGEDGNDVLRGRRGSDLLDGGDGNDRIFAGQDGDTIFGGAGNDVIHGGQGNDFVDAGAGNDRIFDDHGDDILLGGDGHDLITDRRGNNILLGGAGDDTILGGRGRDLIIGGTGRDVLFGEGDQDLLIGGTTDYDNDLQALNLLLSTWTQHTSYHQRKQQLMDGAGTLDGTGIYLSGETIHDDHEHDSLIGGCGLDLVFEGLLDDILG